MYLDPSGESWVHWGIATGIVIILAVATVISCGGVGVALGAITLAGNGIGLIGLSGLSTGLAFATAGSALGLASGAIYAGLSSSSLDEFASYGSTGLFMTVTGGFFGAYAGYKASQYNKYYFPDDPDKFNPNGLERYDYPNRIIKWQQPGRGKALFEYNGGENPHYHITTDGSLRDVNPFTGDTHMYPGDPIPYDFWNYFN